MLLKDTVFRNLLALLFVFTMGYGALVTIHLTFNRIIEEFDEQIKNEQARYKIGEYILKEISDLESKFYKLATLFNENAALNVKQEILQDIALIHEAIDVLENGGTLRTRIELNLVEIHEVLEEASYKKTSNGKQVFEAIDLKPKLADLQKKLNEMINIIKLKQRIVNNEEITSEEKQKSRLKIEIFFKKIPSHFIRMRENTSRLLYESKQNRLSIEKNIQNQKFFYLKLEVIVTFLVAIIVVVLGYILSRQIQRTSKQLRIASEDAKRLAFEADQANIAKSQFLANMSHDIRTPLNAIIGFSELLCHAPLPLKEQEQAHIVSRSAKALLDIINDILDISKVESGKFEIVSEPFDVRASFEQMIELFSVKAKEKHIRLIYNADPAIPPFLIGDFIRLQQVFSNLLSNAIKFTPERGCVCFEVAIVTLAQNSVALKFSVTDSGIGISTEQQSAVFEAFTQADGSISRKYGGTGLGLSISLKIVEMMGSRLELDSEEGRGSCFYFSLAFSLASHQKKSAPSLQEKNYQYVVLPLESDREKLRISLVSDLSEVGNIVEPHNLQSIEKIDLLFLFKENLSTANLNKLKQRFNCPVVFVGDSSVIGEYPEIKSIVEHYLDVPIYGAKVFNLIEKAFHITPQETEIDYLTARFNGKILVAEDNENNQKLIEVLLGKLGLECDLANNGEEALELYQKNTYDLVFLDVNMPVMDGVTAVKIIKTLDKTAIPIIALTANTIKGDKEKYLSAGMDDYLSKPIIFKALVEVVHRYLNVSTITEPLTPLETNSMKYSKALTMQQLELDEETVDMLLDGFFETLDPALENLRTASRSQNHLEIYKAAHFLKGSCANLAMYEAVDILQEFETNARESIKATYDLKSLEKLFQEINANR